MELLTDVQNWGRSQLLKVFSRTLRTPRISPLEAARTLQQNPAPTILFIGLYQKMGQFLCSTPLIRAFATAWPQASFYFLGNPSNEAAALANPHLKKVWIWNKSGMGEWKNQFAALRSERFDLAILLTTERPSATGVFLARAMGARWVGGFVPANAGEWQRDTSALYHIQIPASTAINEVQKYLGIAEAFGLSAQGLEPEFQITAEDKQVVKAFFPMHQLPNNKPWVGLFVGGKPDRTDRLWPVSHLARLADSLKAAGIEVIALCPPPAMDEEHQRLDSFQKELSWPCPVFQDGSLGRIAAFLQRLQLLITPDGGILHLAAAVGTPTLGLFFSTDPEVWKHSITYAIDGRQKPSAQLQPQTVTHEVIRLLGMAAAI